MNDNNNDPANSLPQKGEAQNDTPEMEELSSTASVELIDLVANLNIYQSELEAQNDELKQAQAAVQEQSVLNAKLFNYAPVGYLTLNSDLVIQRVNIKALDILASSQRNRSILRSLSAAKYLHTTFIEDVSDNKDARKISLDYLYAEDESRGALIRWLRSRSPAALELRFAVNPPQWHLLQMQTLDENLLLVSITDISQRVIAQQKREQASGRYQSIFQAADDGIIEVNDLGRVVTANRRAESLFGYDVTEMTQMSVEELIPMRYRGHHKVYRKGFASSARNTKAMASRQQSVFALTKQGEEVPVEVRLSNFVVGEKIHTIATIRDIRDRIHLVEERDKATKTSADNMSLLSVAGHEIRNPAAALKMMTDEMLSHTEVSRADVAELGQLAAHIVSLLDDISVIKENRILRQTSADRRQAVDLPDTISSVVSGLSDLANTHQIRVKVEQEADSQAISVVVDPKPVRQILTNLIKNAILHSEGTAIRVSIDHQVVSEQMVETEICVEDDGVGIPEKDRERVFEAFQRGNSQEEGSGLGLHVIKLLVKEMKDSEIVLEDNQPKGSRFRFSFLSRIADGGSTRTALKLPAEPLKGLRIILAEDSDVLRKLTQKALEVKGATVSSFENGLLAYEAVTQEGCDLVITDILMPVMDGYSLTTFLRNDKHRFPIIGLTGATVADEANKLLDLGANTVLSKPLDISALVEVLAQCTGNNGV